MRLIIAGGRDFDEYEYLQEVVNDYIFMYAMDNPIEIVSGDARGADSLGIKYANRMEWKIKHFPADWNTHGKKAGFLRNEEMAKYGTHLIAFWDGKSKGTKHMINSALNNGLHIAVVRYE